MTLLGAAAPALTRVRREFRAIRTAPSVRGPELVRMAAGPVAVAVSALAVEVLRLRGIRLPDPMPLLLVVVVAAGVLGGRRVGVLAAFLAVAYALLFFSRAPWPATPDNALRVLMVALGTPAAAWLVGGLRDRSASDRRELAAQRELTARLQDFSTALAGEQVDTLHRAVVAGIPYLVDCDLVALTVAGTRDGRHFVRAVHGADPSTVGTEILPGVGATGQAIRDRRMVVADGVRHHVMTADAGTPGTRLTSRSAATVDAPVAAAPVLVDGRVTATVTVARTRSRRPFAEPDREALERLTSVVGLILANAELRAEAAASALRDPLTGLANRNYLDATLDQLLALRRRSPAESRGPISLLVFDVDGFRRFNEQHGRAAGDRALQAIGGIVRARFRASDILARVGGDAFVAVLDGAMRDDAARAAGDVRSRVRALSIAARRGARVRVSVSAGCATFDGAEPSGQAMIRSAEAALDTARWSGPDSIVSI